MLRLILEIDGKDSVILTSCEGEVLEQKTFTFLRNYPKKRQRLF